MNSILFWLSVLLGVYLVIVIIHTWVTIAVTIADMKRYRKMREAYWNRAQ